MSPDVERRAMVALSFLAKPGDPVLGEALRTRTASEVLALVTGADADGEALLAEKGSSLGGPWSEHLEGEVWELRLRLAQIAVRVTYWCAPDITIVFLTVFRKTRQHDQRQIDRAVRAQHVCERDHPRPADEVYERQA